MDLTEHQWEIIEPLIPAPKSGHGKRGRPAQPARAVLEAVLWVLRTGAPWHDLPSRYPPYQTCHRRFQRWVDDGTLRGILVVLGEDLRERGGIEEIEAYIDGSYAGAKKGDPQSGGVVPARRQRSWQLQTTLVFLSPLALRLVQDTMCRSSTTCSTKPSWRSSHPS